MNRHLGSTPRRSALSLEGLRALLGALSLVALSAATAAAQVASQGDNTPLPPPDGSGNVAITFSNDGFSVGGVGAGALSVTGGALLSVSGTGLFIAANAGGATGLITIDGPGSRFTTGPDVDLLIGHGEVFTFDPDGFDFGIDRAPTAGHLVVRAGASLESRGLTLGTFRPGDSNATAGFAHGLLELSGAGTTGLVLEDDLHVAFIGDGTLRVLDGAALTATALTAAGDPLSSAVVEVSGPGARLEIQAGARFPDDGEVTVSVLSGGALVSRGALEIAHASTTARAETLVSGPGSLLAVGGEAGIDGLSGTVIVGSEGGDGRLTIEDAARMTVSEWTDPLDPQAYTAPELFVGQNGTGSLTVRSGALLEIARRAPGIGAPFLAIGGGGFALRGIASAVIQDAGTSVTLSGANDDGAGSVFGPGLRIGGALALGAVEVKDGASLTLDGGAVGGSFAAIGVDGGVGSLRVATGGRVRVVGGPGGASDSSIDVGRREPGGEDLPFALGTLEVASGGSVETTFLSLGRGVDTTGTALIEAGGLVRLSGADIDGFGPVFSAGRDGGSGEIRVRSDGVTGGVVLFDAASGEGSLLRAGRDDGSSGAISLAGPGTLVRFEDPSGSGAVQIGRDGTGSLEVRSGARIEGAHLLQIGRGATSSGAVAIDGVGSAVLLERTTDGSAQEAPGEAPRVVVGAAGGGTLVVSGGASLEVRTDTAPVTASTTEILVGGGVDNTGGNGFLVASGAGSRVAIEGERARLVVGNSGTGELQILSGAEVTVAGPDSLASTFVARLPGTSGLLIVSGTASRLAAGALLGVGLDQEVPSALPQDGGTGEVRIEAGGLIEATDARLSSTGTLSGDGALTGSLTLAGGLLLPGVAGGAPGTLAISGGLTVSSGTIQVEATGAGAGQSDALSVGGVAAFTGGVIAIDPQGAYTPAIGDRLQVLRAQGGFSGLESITVTGLPPGTEARLVPSGDRLSIEVVPLGQGGVDFSGGSGSGAGSSSGGGGCAIATDGATGRARRIPVAAVAGVLLPWAALVGLLLAQRARRKRVVASPLPHNR